jgi:hypothetical protein
VSPWNKGKLVGAKPPLRPNQAWSIRLLIEGRARDLALFNLAIGRKLRDCDSPKEGAPSTWARQPGKLARERYRANHFRD